MNNKAVSPLIVTVMLIGVTIVVSVVVFSFGMQIQTNAIDNQETDLTKLGLVQFSAYYRGEPVCVPENNSLCYSLLLVNNEDFDLRFVVKTHTSLGMDISGPEGLELGAYEQKVFIINYPVGLGEVDIYAEVDAVV